MGNHLSQIFPREAPTLTEANISRQDGRVFLVTGGYGGIGYHISRILYLAGGTVYIAGRDRDKAQKAIDSVKAKPHGSSPNKATPDTTDAEEPHGKLEFLYLDLADLSTIKPAAEAFLRKEQSLDVLFHNAGVSLAPTGSRTKQGNEMMMGTNALGPWLLNHLLTPAITQASKTASAKGENDRVRVIWTASNVVDLTAPTGGLVISELDDYANLSPERNYLNSKTGNFFLASESHQRVAKDHCILSLTVNPGGLKTDLLRHKSNFFKACVSWLLYPAVMGAYTVLWAGLSDELSVTNDGGIGWIVPWGRKHPGLRPDLVEATKEGAGEEQGRSKVFWEWCETKCKEFM